MPEVTVEGFACVSDKACESLPQKSVIQKCLRKICFSQWLIVLIMIRSSEESTARASTSKTSSKTIPEAPTKKQHQAREDHDDSSDNDASNNRDDDDDVVVVGGDASTAAPTGINGADGYAAVASAGVKNVEERHDQQQVFNSDQYDHSEQQGDNKSDHDNSKPPKRNPFCSRCRNHGKSIQVKGHKRHCEYRECKCEGCFDVECRQIISARQIKRRRDQKQDEECGRRIEISPPVLRREKCIDPIALTPETLRSRSSEIIYPTLKPNNPIHHQLHVATATTPQAIQQQSPLIPPSSHHLHHPHPLHPATLAAAVASSSALSIQHPTSNHHTQFHNHHLQQLHHSQHQSHHHHNPHKHHLHHQQQQQVMSCVNDTNHQQLTNNNLHDARINLTNLASVVNSVSHPKSIQHQHHHHPTTPTTTGHNAVACTTATNAVAVAAAAEASSATQLTNALNLFRYPRSMLVSAAATAPPQQPPAGLSASLTNGLGNNNHILQPPLPSIREQINLVEEIHHTFGPLAIYAWLKAEHFDLQKVRDSIENSLTSYNNLTDLKFKYRLSNTSSSGASSNADIASGGAAGISGITSTNNKVDNNHQQQQHQYSTITDNSITNDVNSVNCNHSGINRNGFTAVSTTTTTTTNTSSSSSDDKSNNNKKSLPLDTTTTNLTTPPSSSTTVSIASTTTTSIAPTPISIAKTISNYRNISSTTPTSTNLPTSPICRISSSLFNNSNNYTNSDNNNVSKTATSAHHHNHTMSLASTLNSLPMSTANGLLWPDLKLATNGVPRTSVIHPHHLLPHFMHHPFMIHQNQQVSPLSSIANLSSSSESSSSTIL